MKAIPLNKLLIKNGLKHHEGNTFENNAMPYYAIDGIVLLYNKPVTFYNENDFLIGKGEYYDGKYYVVTFRWIHTWEEFLEVYKAVFGRDYLKREK